jgi:hypothetical protein
MVPSLADDAASRRDAMLAERLSKAWDERRESTAIDPVARFTNEGTAASGFGASNQKGYHKVLI